MKSTILLAVAAALLAPHGNAQNAKAEQEVRDLEQKYNAAYARNDLAEYFSYLANDFNQYLPGGRTNKQSYVDSWTKNINAGNKVLAADLSDLVIQSNPTGDAVVASYVLRVKEHSVRTNSDGESEYQETDVWFKRRGEWKVVHLNYAPKRAPRPQGQGGGSGQGAPTQNH